jgi:hypothetical protein
MAFIFAPPFQEEPHSKSNPVFLSPSKQRQCQIIQDRFALAIAPYANVRKLLKKLGQDFKTEMVTTERAFEVIGRMAQ